MVGAVFHKKRGLFALNIGELLGKYCTFLFIIYKEKFNLNHQKYRRKHNLFPVTAKLPKQLRVDISHAFLL